MVENNLILVLVTAVDINGQIGIVTYHLTFIHPLTKIKIVIWPIWKIYFIYTILLFKKNSVVMFQICLDQITLAVEDLLKIVIDNKQ